MKHTWQQQKYYRVIMAEVARFTGMTVYDVEIQIMKRISEDIYFWLDYVHTGECRSTTTFTKGEMSLVCARFNLYIWHHLGDEIGEKLPKEDNYILIDQLHQEHQKTQIL